MQNSKFEVPWEGEFVFFGGRTQGGVRGLTLPWADELLPLQGAGKWLAAVSDVQRGGLAGVRLQFHRVISRRRRSTWWSRSAKVGQSQVTPKTSRS